MKKIYFLIVLNTLIGILLFSNSKEVKAQTCGGTVTCCEVTSQLKCANGVGCSLAGSICQDDSTCSWQSGCYAGQFYSACGWYANSCIGGCPAGVEIISRNCFVSNPPPPTPPPQICNPGQWYSPSCGGVCGSCDSGQCNSSGTGWNCVANPGLCCPSSTPPPSTPPPSTPPPSGNLTVNLTMNPSSGTAPLNGVQMTSTVGGTVAGPWKLEFDCQSDGVLEMLDWSSINPYTSANRCYYSTAGTYTARVRASKDGTSYSAIDTATVVVSPAATPPPATPTPAPATLSVSVNAIPNIGVSPLSGVDLRADVGGTATGNIRYRFDCTNNGTYERDITTSADPYTATDLCSYTSAGNYTARVLVTRGGINASGTVGVAVGAATPPPSTPPPSTPPPATPPPSTPPPATVGVNLSAIPNTGTRPLSGVDLRADVTGTATGNIRYRLDCTNNGTYERDITTSADPYTAANLCSYSTAGTYTARALVTRAGVNASGTTTINVANPPPPSAPAAPTGLSGSCPLPGTGATVRWNAVSGATAYELRVDNKANAWNGSCTSPNSGDFCLRLTGTSHSFTTASGGNYDWWVHAVNSSGWSTASSSSFSCGVPATPIPTPVPTPAPTPPPSINTNLSAAPSVGDAPLVGVSLTSSVGGSASGNIRYQFDCTSDGTIERDVTSGSNPYTASGICSYGTAGNYTARVVVTRSGVTSSATTPVNVRIPPPPSVDLKANGSDGPLTLNYNSTPTLSWVATNAASCVAQGGWNGVRPTFGQETVGPLTSLSNTFTLRCSGPGGTRTDSVSVSILQPSCRIRLSPNPLEVVVGETVTAAVVREQEVNGQISEVRFSVDDSSIASASSPDTTAPIFTSSVQGLGVGTTTLNAQAYMFGTPFCSATANISAIPPGPWWQAGNGEVISRTGIATDIPNSCNLFPSCTPYGILNGPDGPGVAITGGSSDFGRGSVSSTRWLAQTTYNGTIYSHAFFDKVGPSGAFASIPSVIRQGSLTSGSSTNGYYWYKASGGNFVIDQPINLGNARTVVLLGSSSLDIRANITLGNDGFLLFVVGGSGGTGNIRVSPNVTRIDGMYIADNNFTTGTGGAENDQPLIVNGTVIAWGNVVLDRNLGDGNVDTSSETFNFNPELINNFPPDLNLERVLWKEIAP